MAHAASEEAVAERSANGDEGENGVLAEFESVLQLLAPEFRLSASSSPNENPGLNCETWATPAS
jgi:hypothetical protein